MLPLSRGCGWPRAQELEVFDITTDGPSVYIVIIVVSRAGHVSQH